MALVIGRRQVLAGGMLLAGSTIAQALAAVTGLILARWLPVADYALYVAFVTLMGAVSLLGRGGSHFGYTAILGRVWHDYTKVAAATASVMAVRRRLGMVVMPPVLMLAAWLFFLNGAQWLLAFVLTALLLVFWWADFRGRVVDQVLYFAGQSGRVQALDIVLALARLALVAACFVSGQITALLAVIIGVGVAVTRIVPLRLWVQRLLGPKSASPEVVYVDEIGLGVRRQWPVDLYTVLQAQIVLASLSIFGGPLALAGFGAVTRIQQLLLPVDAFVYAFCVPIFAKAYASIGKVYVVLVAITALPSLLLSIVAASRPDLLLMLVGENYAGLHTEMLLAALLAALTRVALTGWSLLAHRGWTRWSRLQIPAGIVAAFAVSTQVNIGSITGALMLQGAFASGLIVATAAELIAARHRGVLTRAEVAPCV